MVTTTSKIIKVNAKKSWLSDAYVQVYDNGYKKQVDQATYDAYMNAGMNDSTYAAPKSTLLTSNALTEAQVNTLFTDKTQTTNTIGTGVEPSGFVTQQQLQSQYNANIPTSMQGGSSSSNTTPSFQMPSAISGGGFNGGSNSVGNNSSPRIGSSVTLPAITTNANSNASNQAKLAALTAQDVGYNAVRDTVKKSRRGLLSTISAGDKSSNPLIERKTLLGA